MIGIQVDVPGLVVAWQPIAWAVLAVLVERVIVVYGLRLPGGRVVEPVPMNWSHVMAWGGLRDAISLALALSPPAALGADRSLLQVMTFGVTLFTLLIQGTTMSWLIRQLGVVKRSDAQVEYETRHARLIAVRTAQEHLERLHRQGLLSGRARETLKPDLDRRVAAMADAVREVLRAEPHLEAQEWDKAHREALRAQRSALVGLRRNGVISEEVYGRLSQEIDAVLVDERLFSPAGTDKTDAAILGNASEESV